MPDVVNGVHLENELSNLKPDALLSLTEKIQINLQKASIEKTHKFSATRPRKERKLKKDVVQSEKLPAKVSKAREERKNGKAESIKDRTSYLPKPQQREKRFRDSTTKAPSNSKSESNSTVLGVKGNKIRKGSFKIEEEILALGGSKDDYELIAEAPSDSEIEATDFGEAKTLRSDLQKNLARLVREIGIPKAQAEAEEKDLSLELSERFTNGKHITTSREIPTTNTGNDGRSMSLPARTAAKSSSHLVLPFQYDCL